jgi:hypothetical protein
MSQDKARWTLEDALEKLGFSLPEIDALLERFLNEEDEDAS